MGRVFVNRPFDRWARKERVGDSALTAAVIELEAGLWDANLGGGLFKKRVARRGQGKSGGYRTMVAFRAGDKAFFLYGFAKSERDNVGAAEKRALKALAEEYLALGPEGLARALGNGVLRELEQEDEPEAQQDSS